MENTNIPHEQQPQWLQDAHTMLTEHLPANADFVLLVNSRNLIDEEKVESNAIGNCCPCHLYQSVQVLLKQWGNYITATHTVSSAEHKKFDINPN